MMSYLRQVDYQDRWRLWPGQGDKYLAGGGHSVLLATYLNPTAYEALIEKRGFLPPDSIVVKNNYTIDG